MLLLNILYLKKNLFVHFAIELRSDDDTNKLIMDVRCAKEKGKVGKTHRRCCALSCN